MQAALFGRSFTSLVSGFSKELKHPLTKNTLPISATALRFTVMTDGTNGKQSENKTYHEKATGNALKTAENHSQEKVLKLYGGCFWYGDNPRNPLRTLTWFKPIRATRLDISGAEEVGLRIH